MARPRGNSWQADVTDKNGKRVRKSFKTEQQAVAYENGIAGRSDGATLETLGEYIDRNFDCIWGSSTAPHASRTNCDVILKYLGPDMAIPDITAAVIDGCVVRYRNDGAKNGTINRKLATLSKLLRHAERRGVIDKRPHIAYLREDGARDRMITHEEEDRMRQFFRQAGLLHSGAYVDFLLYTGCRSGEALKLHRQDVSGGRVIFRGRKDTKVGDNITRVPLIGPAKDAWEFICKETDADKPFGALIKKRAFRGHWGALKQHMGLMEDECFVPHILRHTCASRMAMAGVDLPRIMKWMGHSNIQTTMRYLYLAPKELEKAAEALLRH